MKKKILLSIMLMWIGIFSLGVPNISAEENVAVYIDEELSTSIGAKFIDGDVYLCVEDMFRNFGYEVSSSRYSYEYVRIRANIYNESYEEYDDEEVACYRYDSKKIYADCITCNEEGMTYLGVDTDSFTKRTEYDDDYEYKLKKPMEKDDINHHYAYYKDIQILLNFDLVPASEINGVAIYIKEDIPNSITLYDKKGNAVEVCPLFESKYIDTGYKKNKNDVLMFPESKIVSADEIKVSLNGALLEFDVAPTTINDRTMVPLRAIFETLGATVDWDENTQTIIAKKMDTTIKITVDSDKMNVNGKSIALDSPATVVDGRTLVPVRAISESFGIGVNWDELNSRVILREPQYANATTAILYNSSNQVVEVPDFEIASFVTNGWFTEKPVRMYAPDGRTQVVAANEVDANKKVGWYTQPVITMYAPDGRTQIVAKGDVESNKAVGWYDYPVTTMYAPDGRTIVISTSEVQNYKNVGWYEDPASQNANPKLSKDDIEIKLNPNGSSIIFVNKSGSSYSFSFLVVNGGIILRPYNRKGNVIVKPGETKFVDWIYDGTFNTKGTDNGLNSYGNIVIEWNGKQYYADFTVNGITTFYRGNARSGPIAE